MRTAVAILTIAGTLLALVEVVRLPRLGPWVRALLPFVIFYTWPLLIPPPARGAVEVVLEPSTAQRVSMTLQALLVIGLSGLQLLILLYGATRIALYRRYRAARIVVYVYLVVAFAVSIAMTFDIARYELFLQSGYLMKLALYMGLVVAGLLGAQLAAHFLDRALRDKRVALVLSVFLLCTASMLDLLFL